MISARQLLGVDESDAPGQQLELFALAALIGPAQRQIVACHYRGATIEDDEAGCADHPGSDLVDVTVWRPIVALGLTDVCTEEP